MGRTKGQKHRYSRSHKTKEIITKEYLISKLKEAHEMLGGDLTGLRFRRLVGFPGEKSYRNHFGTWTLALKAANIKIDKRRKAQKNRCASLALRFSVLERDGFRCKYCGMGPKEGAKLFIDHVVPWSMGGLTEYSNLAAACFDCNSGKSATEMV